MTYEIVLSKPLSVGLQRSCLFKTVNEILFSFRTVTVKSSFEKMNAIEISGLKKSFGDVEALAGIDLTLREGEFFGLLGPNGAGKTTLINSLVGLVRPDNGSVTIFGHDIQRTPFEAKRHLGLSPQDVNINTFMPIEKILQFQGGFYGLPWGASKKQAQKLLEQFGLWDKRKGGRHQLSGGMQKRLMIARALMGSPQVLILDEPTAGLDVELRHELWTFLDALRAQKVTLLLTTHYIDEAEQLCDRVAIIHHGKIIACDTPAQLIAHHSASGVKNSKNRFVRPGSLEAVFVNLTGQTIAEEHT